MLVLQSLLIVDACSNFMDRHALSNVNWIINFVSVSVLLWECVVETEQWDLCSKSASGDLCWSLCPPAKCFEYRYVLSMVKMEENMNTGWWEIAWGKRCFSQEVVKSFRPVAKQSLLVFKYADPHGQRGIRPSSLCMLCSLCVHTRAQCTLLETWMHWVYVLLGKIPKDNQHSYSWLVAHPFQNPPSCISPLAVTLSMIFIC